MVTIKSINSGSKRRQIVSDPRLLLDGSDLQVRRLLHGFLMLGSRLQKLHAAVASVMQLTESQYIILMSTRHLGAINPPSISELAKYLNLSHSFVTNQVAVLCERKLLAKQTDKNDGRVMLLSLTQEAFRLMDQSMPKIAKLNDVILASIPADQIPGLLSILQATITNADTALKLSAYISSASEPHLEGPSITKHARKR